MKKTIFFLSLCVSCIIYSQEYKYDFSIHNETYEALTNGISANNETYWDDESEFTIPIGFDFQLADKTISTLYVFANTEVLTESNSAENVGNLTMFFADIKDRGTESNSQSPISYKTEGDVGNKIFKLEWKNIGFWDGVSDDYANLQLWLYEGTNIIEFHYGNSNITNATDNFDGNNGPAVYMLPSQDNTTNGLHISTPAYLLSGSSTSPTAMEIIPGEESTIESAPHLDNMIPSGTVYRFKPHEDLSNSVYKNSEVSIYPNPVENKLNIHSIDNKNYEALIYNNLGQLIKQTATNSQVDVSKLNSGLYFVKIKKEKTTVTQKFIKR